MRVILVDGTLSISPHGQVVLQSRKVRSQRYLMSLAGIEDEVHVESGVIEQQQNVSRRAAVAGGQLIPQLEVVNLVRASTSRAPRSAMSS